MKSTQNLHSDIRYIGTFDSDIDLFESQYKVPQGVSYNSYLILDEKITIMDTVDARRRDEWWQLLLEALDGRQPSYLVVHHVEPDHSGAIQDVMKQWPDCKIVASQSAIKLIGQFYGGNPEWLSRSVAVKDGQVVELGKHSLQFVSAAMIHWPEVMVSYDAASRTLFSADAFGKFGPADDDNNWADEARRYYINICGKYGKQVQTLLRRAGNLDIETICPLHGPVLHAPLTQYLSLYDTWSNYRPEVAGTLVAVASIHGGTRAVGEYIAEHIQSESSRPTTVIDLSRTDMSVAVAEAFRHDSIVLCAASYDADVFPPMREFIEHIRMKGFCNRRVGLVENGSWAPSAGRVMRSLLADAPGVEILEPMVTIRSRMNDGDLPAISALIAALSE
ncbi:MAG: MBL fold metallo-hydrolase [Muribaculaceae bacterium]|nr:MBL fold metallo-hydrolase [Muribaculaceae bacterium]